MNKILFKRPVYGRFFLPFFIFVAALPASAQLNFINKSPYKVYVAVGYHENGTWRSKGWYPISPGDKATPFNRLKKRYYYYYAVDEHGNRWYDNQNGGYFYFHPANAFETSFNCYDCKGANFKQIDTKEYDEFTLELTFSFNGYCYDGYCLGSWGKSRWKNGDRYQGDFNEAGERHGQGKYTWKSGAYYTGSWVNDRAHGTGMLYYSNGGYFEGNYFNDKRWGEGTEYDQSGHPYLSGRWEDGVLTKVYDKANVVWQDPPENNITVSDNKLPIRLNIESKTEIIAWYIYVNDIEADKSTKSERHDRLLAQSVLDLGRFNFGELRTMSAEDSREFFSARSYALVRPDFDVAGGDEGVAAKINTTITLRKGKNKIYVKAVNQGGSAYSSAKTIYYQP